MGTGKEGAEIKAFISKSAFTSSCLEQVHDLCEEIVSFLQLKPSVL
jgi:hypothetical protein